MKTGLSGSLDFHGFCPGFQCVGGGLSDFSFIGLCAGCTFGLSLLPLDLDLLDLSLDLDRDLDDDDDLDLLLSPSLLVLDFESESESDSECRRLDLDGGSGDLDSSELRPFLSPLNFLFSFLLFSSEGDLLCLDLFI